MDSQASANDRRPEIATDRPVPVLTPRTPGSGTAERRDRAASRLATAVLVGLVALGAAGAVWAAQPRWLTRWTRRVSANFARVAARRVDLPMRVVARGSLASTRSLDVINRVQGQTTIIRILPEGTRVRAGEVVCELDSALLRDSLTNQIITTKAADVALETAVKTREVAEIAVREYREGTYIQSHQAARGDLVLAESELTRATDRLAWTEKMLGIKYVSESERISDRSTLLKAQNSMTHARGRLRVLELYTLLKTVTQLEAAVEKARVDELAKRVIYERQRGKQEKLEDQIAKCELRAPADGMIVYANDPGGSSALSGPKIIEGAAVRERQRIFSLPDISRLRVDVKVNETEVARLAPGQRARIRVEGDEGAALSGSVLSVQPLPDTPGQYDTGVRIYTARVTIDDPRTGLMPAKSARVEILVDRADDVLAIPLRAVARPFGRDCVMVATPDGAALREVQLGVSNDRLVQVVEGLREGEEIALDPGTLLAE